MLGEDVEGVAQVAGRLDEPVAHAPSDDGNVGTVTSYQVCLSPNPIPTNNDCNAATADGADDPLVGLSCDGTNDADLCQEGTTYCGDGDVLCDDPGDLDRDLCNGSDDDCDPGTPDGAHDSDVDAIRN